MPEKRTNRANLARHGNHMSVTSTTVAFALSRGMTLAEIEEVTGMDAVSLGDPEARLDDTIPNKIWHVLSRRVGPDVALSIEAARAAPFSALAGLVHGAQFAPTLRDALAFLSRNQGQIADRLNVELIETDEDGTIRAFHPNDRIDRGRVAEFGTGIVCRLVRDVLGVAVPPIRAEFPFEPLGPEEAYRNFFRCPAIFNTGNAALVFAKDTLNLRAKNADPTLFEFVERHFQMSQRQADARHQSPDLIRLRNSINEAAKCGDYRTNTIAARAGLSVRSAQRIAAANGTSITELVRQARQNAAETLLTDHLVSIQTIASLLGFSDDRSFRRAFKLWTGVSPSHFRKTKLQGTQLA